MTTDPRAACRALVADLAATVLAVRADGTRVTLADGYVPLLVDHTEEDRHAKGLRKLQPGEAPRPPVHDTMLEAASEHPLLLLTGPAGSGKTTSLLHLAIDVARMLADDVDAAERPVPRNDAGTVRVERWTAGRRGPRYVAIDADGGTAFERTVDGEDGIAHLLLVDDAERFGDDGPVRLAELAALAVRTPDLRIVVAGDADVCRTWRRPPGFVHRRLLPLLDAQRDALQTIVRASAPRALRSDTNADVLGSPGFFTLALENGVVDRDRAAVVDRWLVTVNKRNGLPSKAPDGALADDDRRRVALSFVACQRDARRLAEQSADDVVAFHRDDPLARSAIVRAVAARLVAAGRPVAPLVAALVDGTPYGAIDAMRIAAFAGIADDARLRLVAALATIVDAGELPPVLRDEAGRGLAELGDPRDLDALVSIASGTFPMGSTTHPNSMPVHPVTVGAFRIGRHPVTNDRYAGFVAATGRTWRSPDGTFPRRSNSPAVDLTWHDARAYCAWLTARWRDEGRIACDEVVRLPTEPEWECAARGGQPGDGFVYPWGGAWKDDSANAEEAGFNDTCAVGLFPHGRSADGCDDLAGQVWEWTSTLWGEDMTTPRFAYPYRDDGREAIDAPAHVRRVLRGGCFLSPKEKANCTYRGSLEPDGYWRGNGFRIVVATVGD